MRCRIAERLLQSAARSFAFAKLVYLYILIAVLHCIAGRTAEKAQGKVVPFPPAFLGGTMNYVLTALIAVAVVLIISNIRIVPQSFAFVIERLGAYQMT